MGPDGLETQAGGRQAWAFQIPGPSRTGARGHRGSRGPQHSGHSGTREAGRSLQAVGAQLAREPGFPVATAATPLIRFLWAAGFLQAWLLPFLTVPRCSSFCAMMRRPGTVGHGRPRGLQSEGLFAGLLAAAPAPRKAAQPWEPPGGTGWSGLDVPGPPALRKAARPLPPARCLRKRGGAVLETKPPLPLSCRS